jgi:hypothetical protein
MDYLYNIGDMVIVKADLRMNVDYYMKSGPHGTYSYNNVVDDMKKFAGTVVHIAKHTEGQYLIEEDGYNFAWTDEMFEDHVGNEYYCTSLL